MTELRFSWTQPICGSCWEEMHPDREPVKLVSALESEQCCKCALMTNSGIYIRTDPNDRDVTPYPSILKD